jgi:hypothetical protein
LKNDINSLNKIGNALRELGYTEDNKKMQQDYLHFMLLDIFAASGEVFLTEEDIRENIAIQHLLMGTTPNFILKKIHHGRKQLLLT